MILSDNDIAAQLACLPGWRLEAGSLVRRYEFRDWQQALAFVNALGYFAERAGHHPDLELGYGYCTVRWRSHEAGGITAADLAGARRSEELARA